MYAIRSYYEWRGFVIADPEFEQIPQNVEGGGLQSLVTQKMSYNFV